SNNRWQTETRTVTMLLVYSEEAAQRLGDSAMQARLYEGVRLTNEALQNSRANFYVKAVGIMKRQLQGGTLGTVLPAARPDNVIQTRRNEVAADAVYYEGTESGCGLAYINAPATWMVGTGSLNCGTTVMRHEFGHNMGLDHAGEDGGSAPYAKGFGPIKTVMGGNAIPYFANPRLFTQDFGLKMGIEDEVDAVRAMNDRSLAVSLFR
ncbi:MAG: zinc-dependent metalloprotease family protein, partial [Pseudomonadota bacterium]|nr:zinc-dependent metalloprotease family protein [Pseudomonadota bacterium]